MNFIPLYTHFSHCNWLTNCCCALCFSIVIAEIWWREWIKPNNPTYYSSSAVFLPFPISILLPICFAAFIACEIFASFRIEGSNVLPCIGHFLRNSIFPTTKHRCWIWKKTSCSYSWRPFKGHSWTTSEEKSHARIAVREPMQQPTIRENYGTGSCGLFPQNDAKAFYQ